MVSETKALQQSSRTRREKTFVVLMLLVYNIVVNTVQQQQYQYSTLQVITRFVLPAPLAYVQRLWVIAVDLFKGDNKIWCNDQN